MNTGYKCSAMEYWNALLTTNMFQDREIFTIFLSFGIKKILKNCLQIFTKIVIYAIYCQRKGTKFKKSSSNNCCRPKREKQVSGTSSCQCVHCTYVYTRHQASIGNHRNDTSPWAVPVPDPSSLDFENEGQKKHMSVASNNVFKQRRNFFVLQRHQISNKNTYFWSMLTKFVGVCRQLRKSAFLMPSLRFFIYSLSIRHFP